MSKYRYAVVRVENSAAPNIHDVDALVDRMAEQNYRLAFVDHARMWFYFEKEVES